MIKACHYGLPTVQCIHMAQHYHITCGYHKYTNTQIIIFLTCEAFLLPRLDPESNLLTPPALAIAII